MKVLAIVFSTRRDADSQTLLMTEEICRKIRKYTCADDVAVTEILTMSEVPVRPCTGCKTCFRKGSCPQDEADGMQVLRRKMEDCDALLVATPVYMAMVSGWCKTFLDRCASYCHVFELLGKPCLVLSVTGISGGERAGDYLSECMEIMGCAVAGMLPLQKVGEGLVIGKKETEDAMDAAVTALFHAMETPEQYISPRAEDQFTGIQRFFRSREIILTLSGRVCTSEINTFRSRGFMHCPSLREALRREGGSGHEESGEE